MQGNSLGHGREKCGFRCPCPCPSCAAPGNWVQSGKEHLCLWLLSWLVLAFSPSPLAHLYCCLGASFKFKRCLKGCRVQCCCWSAAVLSGPSGVKQLLLLERKGWFFFVMVLFPFSFKSREMEKLSYCTIELAAFTPESSHQAFILKSFVYFPMCQASVFFLPWVKLIYILRNLSGTPNLNVILFLWNCLLITRSIC